MQISQEQPGTAQKQPRERSRPGLGAAVHGQAISLTATLYILRMRLHGALSPAVLHPADIHGFSSGQSRNTRTARSLLSLLTALAPSSFFRLSSHLSLSPSHHLQPSHSRLCPPQPRFSQPSVACVLASILASVTLLDRRFDLLRSLRIFVLLLLRGFSLRTLPLLRAIISCFSHVLSAHGPQTQSSEGCIRYVSPNC